MKSIVLVLSILLLGCEPKKPFVRQYTPLQQELMQKYPLDQRAYMEDCLRVEFYSFSSCQEHMAKALNPPRVIEKGGTGILGTAAGAALGFGAAKLLLGK